MADHSQLQGVVREMYGLTCSNHTHNLAGEAWWGSWRQSAVDVIELQNAAWYLAFGNSDESTDYDYFRQTGDNTINKLNICNITFIA